MFNTPYTIDATGTEFELSANSRVFDVVVSKATATIDAFRFTVTANSFSQAATAAVEKANLLRKLYLDQNSGDTSLRKPEEYTPADVREMTVVRSNVYHFRHQEFRHQESHKQA